jgi:hypothetical protein
LRPIEDHHWNKIKRARKIKDSPASSSFDCRSQPAQFTNGGCAKLPDYEDTGGTAPVVYFDIVAAHGVMNGAVQIELAGRTLISTPDGGVRIKFISRGRIRCSPTAATQLRNSIDLALKMLEEPQQSPAAASKLN